MNTPHKTEGAGGSITHLEAIMARLRSETGCPWDREQNHSSIKRYLLEEAYELLEAIDSNVDERMIEELGDVLLQVIFHAQIAQESRRFELETIVKRCGEKLIRRHPHVFSKTKPVKDAEDVLTIWELEKAKEKQESSSEKSSNSILGEIPRHLPALLQADKIQRKAARIGFDWSTTDEILIKIEEELSELRQALNEGSKERISEEIGDLLFSVVNLSRFQEILAEEIMVRAVEKFYNRFRFMESSLTNEGKEISGRSMEELNALWQTAKHSNP